MFKSLINVKGLGERGGEGGREGEKEGEGGREREREGERGCVCK